MSSVRLLPESETKGAITASAAQGQPQRKKRRSENLLAWAAFENLVRRGMEVIIGSGELVETLLLTKSIDHIAGRLNDMIPARCPNENHRRAMILSDGARPDVQREVLKLLLYLISNHMFMNYDCGNLTSYINDARAFVDICRYSGLAEPRVLARIIEISLCSPTMTGVLDLLYEAAIVTSTEDLVCHLLQADSRIDPDRPVGRIWWGSFSNYRRNSIYLSALEFAAFKGDTKFAKHVIQAGANVNWGDEHKLSPLMLALVTDDHKVSGELVSLFLQHEERTTTRGRDEVQRALYLAIIRGSFDSIDLLCTAGADPTLTFRFQDFPSIWFEIDEGSIRKGPDGFVHDHSTRTFIWEFESFSCLGLAASFSTKCFPWGTVSSDDNDQRTALRLVKHILNKAGPEFDQDGNLKSDAMIHAAIRGYAEVISFLIENGARVDSRNSWLCPVYAAVNWGWAEATQLLLVHGGSAQPETRSQKHGEPVELSPLHVAVSYNRADLVDLLLRGGIDVNLLYNVKNAENLTGSGFRIQGGTKSGMVAPGGSSPRRFMSPLNLAIVSEYWEVAFLLIDSGASPTNADLFRTAKAGHYQLVCQLLELEVNPDEAIMNGESALDVSIRYGHDTVAEKLLDAGATFKFETLDLALRYGQHRTATWLIELGIELTGPAFASAFRTLDELALQSLLKAHPRITLSSERDPDGRTFLENAMLSGNIAVIKLALSLDLLAYDSGVLCAAVLIASQSNTGEMDEIMGQILQRRERISHEGRCFDYILENTAVSIAAYNKRPDIIRRLRRHNEWGADLAVLPSLSIWSWPKNTPWFAAERNERIELNSFPDLWEHGPSLDISIVSRRPCSVSSSALRKWDKWHHSDKQLVSPLLLAIKSLSEPVIELLLDIGYRADSLTLRAAMSENISPSLTRRLIEGCGDINGLRTHGMMDPYNPMQVAALSGDVNLVTALLNAGADPNSGPRYAREQTLCKLCEDRRFDIIDILLQRRMSISDTPRIREKGGTVLQFAAARGQLGIMRRLLKEGADPNAPRSVFCGNTAIEAAARHGRLDAVQLLLDSGVEIQGRGRFQYVFAVYLAKAAGHSSVMQLLQSQRPWADTDWETLHELEECHFYYKCIVHYAEYPEDEMAQWLAYTNKLVTNHDVISYDNIIIISLYYILRLRVLHVTI